MWLFQKFFVLGNAIEALEILEFWTSVTVVKKWMRKCLWGWVYIILQELKSLFSGHHTLRLWISNQTLHLCFVCLSCLIHLFICNIIFLGWLRYFFLSFSITAGSSKHIKVVKPIFWEKLLLDPKCIWVQNQHSWTLI